LNLVFIFYSTYVPEKCFFYQVKDALDQEMDATMLKLRLWSSSSALAMLQYTPEVALGPDASLLLDVGAPKEAKDNSGSTPLHLAAQQGHEECCLVLIASGCAVDARKDVSDAHSTSLFIAIHRGHAGVVRLLADAGAQLEARDRNGWTPLFAHLMNI
jgi:hypothetical protein